MVIVEDAGQADCLAGEESFVAEDVWQADCLVGEEPFVAEDTWQADCLAGEELLEEALSRPSSDEGIAPVAPAAAAPAPLLVVLRAPARLVLLVILATAALGAFLAARQMVPLLAVPAIATLTRLAVFRRPFLL